MADVYEQNLASKSTLTTTDYIRVVGSDNVSYKQLVSDVAKKIIENYTDSTLAGSAQSVKSALDSLNSKTTAVTYSDTAVTSGYVPVSYPAGFGVHDIFIVQPSYTGTSQTGGWAATIQPQESQINIYIRTGSGGRPADGTLITFDLIAIKSA